jgi:signal transduction histidine kinase
MVGLATTTQRIMAERNSLVLEGRLLGLAHTAEASLRETGIGDAEELLQQLMPEVAPELLGLVLLDSSGQQIAAVGDVSSSANLRSLDLYLGRFAARGGDHRRGQQARANGWQYGRGRYILRLHLDSRAGALPLAARLLVPATTLIGIALVWLALLAGRFLVRQRQVIQEKAERSRLAALARAGAGLAHQLRTPLATIKGTSQLMAEQCADSTVHSRLETLVTQADRMDRLLGRLLDYARPPAPEPRIIPLVEVVGEVVGRHPGSTAEVAADATAYADPEHLIEILDNLLTNATFFNPAGESVAVKVSVDGETATITVSDHGPGPGEEPEQLFQPYVSSRADGSGLGLPIARNLAQVNGGTLVLLSGDGGGCDAVLTLPAEQAAP